MTTLHCFHGFLGSPRDFDFLRSDYDIVSYNLYQLCEEGPEKIVETVKKSMTAGPQIILGYSFGARLAMRIFLKLEAHFEKGIFMSGHLGLQDPLVKGKRVLFEQRWAEKIRVTNRDDFLELWNGLDLFKNDQDIVDHPQAEKEQLVRFFTEYGLSTQPYLVHHLIKYKEKLSFIYGEADLKYANYAQNELRPAGFRVQFLPGAGHRSLMYPGLAASAIRQSL